MWIAQETLSPSGLKQNLGKIFLVTGALPETQSLEFYDGFGRPLWQQNKVLYRVGKEFVCSGRRFVEIKDKKKIVEPVTAKGKYRFYWDFPEGDLQLFLQKAIKYRGLMPIATIVQKKHRFDLKNKDEKTVIRVELISFYSNDKSRKPYVQYLTGYPLRGFESELKKLLPLLKQNFEPQSGAEKHDPLSLYFELINSYPVEYTAKPDIALQSQQKSREVVIHFSAAMLQVMQQNEQGIREDIDTEFLHDYRIALRKTRSLFSLLDSVFPEEFLAELKPLLSQLGQKTNALRDLDVYLLDKSSYYQLLPESLQPGLDPMFTDFASRRKKEQAALKRYLASKAYQNHFKQIASLIAEAATVEETTDSVVPIQNLASAKIARQYKKIARIGKSIRPTSPDEEVHELRIQCKKLRYLLEFFGGLYDKKTMQYLVKQLKTLQDILGRYNDLCVQKENLFAYLQETSSKKMLLHEAIGALIGVLHQEKHELHLHINEAFIHFNNKSTRSAFGKLFVSV